MRRVRCLDDNSDTVDPVRAAALLLSPLVEAAVARVCGAEAAAVAREPRNVVQKLQNARRGIDDLVCRAPAAVWRRMRHRDGQAALSCSAAQLAHALLAAAAGDALATLVADARVAPDGALLFTTRAGAASVLRCLECGRGFAGRRSLRNHVQDAHASSYGDSISAVMGASAALQQRLLAAEAPPPAPAPALHPGLAAARDGDETALRELVASGWDAATCADRHGSTALLWAAGGGHLGVCRFLCECAGCDPLAARQARDGRSALIWAARNGHASVVAWLLEEHRASPCDATHDGTPALHWAL